MATHPVFRAGNTALITGAASGVGLAVAKLCYEHGMKIALADRNESLLTQERASTFKNDVNARTYPMDVSKIEQWKDLRTKVEMDLGQVSFLMLNAGIMKSSTWDNRENFHAVSQDSLPLSCRPEIDWICVRQIIETNLFGVMNGLTTLLPSLRSQQSPTAIVITGSKQGITNPPGNPAYNASKAAVKSLAEQLSYDLRLTSTNVFLLVPGWTYTGLMKEIGMKEKPDGAWWPEQVADYLEKKMADNQFYVICPDNDVSEETDKKRMLWTVGDIVEGRPPLSRWREKLKDEAAEWMEKQKV